tara:strand:- start:6056 stop:6925 length:870 start_codon:yes stop_codon:yes gene_type:complete
MAIPFISGLNVRPSSVLESGIVNFETQIQEGDEKVFVEIKPNQLQCEAYGYTYNKATGTCSIFIHNIDVATTFDNINNNTQGPRNNVANGVDNTYVMGEENTLESLTKNNIVIGSNNTIKSYVENSSIQGTLGEATATNSIVLGGNATTDTLGERQSIQVLYGYQSVDGSNNSSYLNNTTDSLFAIPDNTVMYFHGDVIAVRVGGTHATGSVGDFASWVERGVIINKSGVLSISRERDTIKSSGTVTNWQPTGIVNGTNFAMRVRGHTDMTIEWCSNITFTQIKTGVTL